MVQALVELDENTNRALNVVKARNGLRDKAAAIKFIVERYIDEEEPELRPEFIAKMRRIERGGKFIPIRGDILSHYEAKHVRSRNRTRG